MAKTINTSLDIINPMSKEAIAVDLDDVVVETAQSVIDYYNSVYGTAVTIDQYYQPNYEEVWGTTDRETAVRRVNSYLETDEYFELPPVQEAIDTLEELDKKFKLFILTGRPDFVQEATERWLKKHFPDLFHRIVFTNHFLHDIRRDKGEVCLELGADTLIDDHLDHALNAAQHGINVLLFGNYPWNQSDALPENVRRVANWREVGKVLLGYE